MTVQTNTTVATGIGNGVTLVFPITFKFNRAEDLIVYRVDAETETETPLTLHSDYTIDGAGSENGGSLTLLAGPLPVGQSVVAQRIVDLRQLTDLRNQGRFFAEVHEDVFDKLVMIDQQQQTQLDRSMVVDLLWRWNALNRRIINVRDPINDGDATNKRYVDAGDAESREHADQRDAYWLSRTIRASDPVAPLPSAAARAGKLISFDNNGSPIAIAAASGSARELALWLGNPDIGPSLLARGVVSVNSIVDLMSLPGGMRREDLRYLVKGSAFLWEGDFKPLSHVGIDAWLPDYEESAEAIEAAIASGWPLDWRNLQIEVGRPINPGTLNHALDWRSDGASIALTAGSFEYVAHLSLPPLSHKIVGKLVFDARMNAYTGLLVLSVRGNCNFDGGGLSAANIYRSGREFTRGDGLFFRGGFSNFTLRSPRVDNVVLAAGAGVPGAVGVAGITTDQDSGTGLYPISQEIYDPRVSNIFCEDPEYKLDQDGCRLFGGGGSGSAMDKPSDAKVIGGEFVDCAGRSIKGKVSVLEVDGTVFRRERLDIADGLASEVDSQTGSLLASNIKAFYRGKAPSSLFRVGSPFEGAAGSSISEVVVNLSGVVLSSVLGTYPTTNVARHIGMQGVHVNGTIERIAQLDTNNDRLFTGFSNIFATEILSEGFDVRAAPGGAPPYSAEINAEHITQLGAPVPLFRQRTVGSVADAVASANHVTGFLSDGMASDALLELGATLRVEGIRAAARHGAVLRVPTIFVLPGETEVFPPHRNNSGVTSSLNFLQVNASNNGYNSLFSATPGFITPMFKGESVTFGGTSDPGGTGLSVWMNSDSSINVKNNTAAGLRVSLMRFG